jgi:NAD dependent epimerase/dehydratase family enzyme
MEGALEEVRTPKTRKVALRSAMTMSPDAGGIFDTLLMLVRRGLGGTAGDGRQFVSWIHFDDFVRAIYWLIDHDEIDGAVNLAAPNPVPNEEFMRTLRQASGTRVGLPATKWMLEIGAVFMRTETELILKSRRGCARPAASERLRSQLRDLGACRSRPLPAMVGGAPATIDGCVR